MRTLAVCVIALAAVGVGCAQGSPATTGGTQLTITVWPEGPDRDSDTWSLRCEPTGGTLPAPTRACRTLLANRGALKPVKRTALCTLIYGGPQVARIRGTVRGETVRASFNRRNGCEIARWNRLRPLFPINT